MANLENLLTELENNSPTGERNKIIRAVFPYPGSKSRSIKQITEIIPYTEKYISVFGGSGCDILAKNPCNLEVFNDRYAGVVAFYRCIRNREKMNSLIELLDLTVHSREDFIWCKETWKNQESDVERAARWYYLINYSFAALGRNFGRSTSAKTFAGKIRNKLKFFPIIHERFKNVQIENLDWEQCMWDYDSDDAVFYCDPPFVDGDPGIYECNFTINDHRRLIDTIFSMKGFVAVSGYSNVLYENQKWDGRHEFNVYISIKSQAYTDENFKKQLKGHDNRGHVPEVLWIKEAK